MHLKTALLTAAFAATVPAANWLIGNVGTECIPNGPCLLPVGFGLHAPSGVLMIGAALVLRDMVHEAGGVKAALAAIAIGGFLAWFVAPPALVIASVAAFMLAELADLVVYAPLRRERLWLAVAASGVVGAIVDSAVFLWLAFGSLDYISGQIVGKFWMSALAAVVLLSIRRAAPSARGKAEMEQALNSERWITVRVEDTGDGLTIHPDDAQKWALEADQAYEGYFLPDGCYRIKIAGRSPAVRPRR